MKAQKIAHKFAFLLGFFQISFSSRPSEWQSGPPDGLPKLTSLDVECGKEDMSVLLEFNVPFDGSIYSKGGSGGKCVHVAPHSHVTKASFHIEYDSCGTRSDPQGKYYENTVILQYDDDVIEAWDEAKKIRCEWHDGYEKSAYKTPITISDLDVVEMNFQGDDVDCWLEIQEGKGPWASKVDGLIPLGSPLTLVVAVHDDEGHFDMRVKSCKAHDGHRHPVYLTDEEGCVLRPKMMTPFQKTRDTKGTASVVSYSHFYAFKFPETMEVNVQCTVEICRHGCPNACSDSRDSASHTKNKPPFFVAGAADRDDIPTYRDSNPQSIVIASKPHHQNQSSEEDNYLHARDGDLTNTSLRTGHSVKMEEEFSSAENVSQRHDEDLTLGDIYNSTYSSHPDNHHDLLDVFNAEERHDKIDEDYNSYDDNKHYYDHPFMIPKDDKDYDQFTEILDDSYGNSKSFSSSLRPDGTLEDSEESIAPESDQKDSPDRYHVQISAGDDHKHSEPQSYLNHSDHNSEFKTNEQKISNHSETTSNVDYFNLHNDHLTHLTSNGNAESHYGLQDEQTNYTEHLLENAQENKNKERGKDYNVNNGNSEPIPIPLDHSVNYDFSETPINQNDNEYRDESTSDEADPYVKNPGEDATPEDYEDATGMNILIPKTTTETKETPKHFQETEDERHPYEMSSQGRKPMEIHGYTQGQAIKDSLRSYTLRHRPFKPPVPVPPLTLYNGVPLHYYNTRKSNERILELEGFRYHAHPLPPYKSESMDFHTGRSGRARGRREIGDKEQLGLQQTFQVIAPTDLAFVTKEGRASLYIGRREGIVYGVCMAPTCLAAGLGLLILANVCVLCIVVFLSYHYFIHRKGKATAIQLICQDIS